MALFPKNSDKKDKPDSMALQGLVRFKKDTFVLDLLRKHEQLTEPMARLIADEIEKGLHQRALEWISPAFLDDAVFAKLKELGLMDLPKVSPLQQAKPIMPPAQDSLSEDILKILALPQKQESQELATPAPQILKSKFSSTFLPVSGLKILEENYCLRNAKGDLLEDARGFLSRIAKDVAHIDQRYEPLAKIESTVKVFSKILNEGLFFPHPHSLKNFGRGPLYPTTALFLGHHLEEMLDNLKKAGKFWKQGISCLINLAKLPQSDPHLPQAGDLMKLILSARGMCKENKEPTASVIHMSPDDSRFSGLLFENLKGDSNLSWVLCISDRHLTKFGLVPSVEKTITEALNLASLKPHSDLVNIIFSDRLEKYNPTPRLGFIEGYSPRQAISLHQSEACFGGFINLANHCHQGQIEWEKLALTLKASLHFLDNLAEMMASKGEKAHIQDRKLGVGVTGFADLLLQLKINYQSNEALSLVETLMSFIQRQLNEASHRLADRRGVFFNFAESKLAKSQRRRHATVTALGDAREVSSIFCVTPGIEPKETLWNYDINLAIQAAFQKFTEEGVFKLIPIHSGITSKECSSLILRAYELGLKSLSFSPPTAALISQKKAKLQYFELDDWNFVLYQLNLWRSGFWEKLVFLPDRGAPHFLWSSALFLWTGKPIGAKFYPDQFENNLGDYFTPSDGSFL